MSDNAELVPEAPDCDVIVVLRDVTRASGERLMNTHSSVLSNHSTVFKRLLEERKLPNEDMTVLRIPTVEFNVFKSMNKWFYTEQLPPDITGAACLKYLDPANTFKIVKLKEQLINKIKNLMQDIDVFKIMEFAKSQEIDSLYNHCMSWMAQRSDYFLTRKAFLNFDVDDVWALLEREDLKVRKESEMYVFFAAKRWAKAMAKLAKECENPNPDESMSSFFWQVLRTIRFPLLNDTQMEKILKVGFDEQVTEALTKIRDSIMAGDEEMRAVAKKFSVKWWKRGETPAFEVNEADSVVEMAMSANDTETSNQPGCLLGSRDEGEEGPGSESSTAGAIILSTSSCNEQDQSQNSSNQVPTDSGPDGEFSIKEEIFFGDSDPPEFDPVNPAEGSTSTAGAVPSFEEEVAMDIDDDDDDVVILDDDDENMEILKIKQEHPMATNPYSRCGSSYATTMFNTSAGLEEIKTSSFSSSNTATTSNTLIDVKYAPDSGPNTATGTNTLIDVKYDPDSGPNTATGTNNTLIDVKYAPDSRPEPASSCQASPFSSLQESGLFGSSATSSSPYSQRRSKRTSASNDTRRAFAESQEATSTHSDDDVSSDSDSSSPLFSRIVKSRKRNYDSYRSLIQHLIPAEEETPPSEPIGSVSFVECLFKHNDKRIIVTEGANILVDCVADFIEGEDAHPKERTQSLLDFIRDHFDVRDFLIYKPASQKESVSTPEGIWGLGLNIQIRLNGIMFLRVDHDKGEIVLNYLKHCNRILDGCDHQLKSIGVSNCEWALTERNSGLEKLSLYRVWGAFGLRRIFRTYPNLKELRIWKFMPFKSEEGDFPKHFSTWMKFTLPMDPYMKNLNVLVLTRTVIRVRDWFKLESNVQMNVEMLKLESCQFVTAKADFKICDLMAKLFPKLKKLFMIGIGEEMDGYNFDVSTPHSVIGALQISCLEWLRVQNLNVECTECEYMCKFELAELLDSARAENSTDFIIEREKKAQNKEHWRDGWKVTGFEKMKSRNNGNYHDMNDEMEMEWHGLNMFYKDIAAFQSYFVDNEENGDDELKFPRRMSAYF